MKAGDVAICGGWFTLLGLLIAFGCASGPAPGPGGAGIANLSQVEPGIWRGGQPKSAADWSYLRSLGLTNDLKLNTGDEASDRDAISAGFHLYYQPIDTMQQLVEGPDPEILRNAMCVMVPGTYVHCEHGQDRTGLIVGLYRLKEGTNAMTAWQEMTNHGFHPALFGLTRCWKAAAEVQGPKSKVQSPK